MHVIWIAYLIALFAYIFVLKSSLEVKLLDVLRISHRIHLTWEYFLD